MPIYSTPDEYSNGYVPSGNVLPKPEGFDVPPPKGTNPAPLATTAQDQNFATTLLSSKGAYGLPLVVLLILAFCIYLKIREG